MHKSRTYEYRIMSRSDWSWPYFIQLRSRGWFLRWFWWTNYSEYNMHPKSIKTFRTLEDATSHVNTLIHYDKERDKKVIIKQVWPEEKETWPFHSHNGY